MKVCCLLLSAGLVAGVVARPVDVSGLPSCSVVDTEVSTNVSFVVPPAGVKNLLVSLELAATPSNNVQVAFGCDANGNGTLEIDETGLMLGWDCGKWVVRGGAADVASLNAGGEWTAEAATTV